MACGTTTTLHWYIRWMSVGGCGGSNSVLADEMQWVKAHWGAACNNDDDATVNIMWCRGAEPEAAAGSQSSPIIVRSFVCRWYSINIYWECQRGLFVHKLHLFIFQFICVLILLAFFRCCCCCCRSCWRICPVPVRGSSCPHWIHTLCGMSRLSLYAVVLNWLWIFSFKDCNGNYPQLITTALRRLIICNTLWRVMGQQQKQQNQSW